MVRLKLVSPITAIGVLIALVCPVQHASTQTTHGGPGTPMAVSIADAEAPPGTEALAVQWVKVAAPNLCVMLAAVARPRGAGPFPTVFSCMVLTVSPTNTYAWLRIWQAVVTS